MGLHLASFNPYAFGLGTACIGGLFLWPHVFRPGGMLKHLALEHRLGGRLGLGSRVPGPIVALVTLSAPSAVLAFPVETIGTRFGGIPAALPHFELPEFNWETVKQLFIPTLTIALLGAVESLLCARVADDLIEAPRHEFARLRHFSTQYRTILLGTFLLTVIFDLTVAVEVGLVLACVFFIYRMSTLFKVLPYEAAAGETVPEQVQVVELYGSLFFGAVGRIETLPAQVLPGTRALVLEMHRLVLIDTSGIAALQELHRQLKRRGVALVLVRVNEQPLSLIRRSGFEAVLGAERIVGGLSELDAALR
jgi:MFS superfamily sulfate permease-like transporter